MSTGDLPRSAACGCASPRRSVTDFVLNPCRRTSAPLPTGAGDTLATRDGVSLQFLAELDGPKVAGVVYRASSCATLVAYAELLAELVVGTPAAVAARISPGQLVASLPGVPRHRQDRAALVVRAWWSALARALEQAEPEPLKGIVP